MVMKKSKRKKVLAASMAAIFANAATANSDQWFYSTYFAGGASLAVTVSPFVFVTQTYDAVRKEFALKMREARDDAASYIASSGEIRGPYLESALKELREDNQFSSFDEPQLVQAILAFSAY